MKTTTYDDVYARSMRDPNAFWAAAAEDPAILGEITDSPSRWPAACTPSRREGHP